MHRNVFSLSELCWFTEEAAICCLHLFAETEKPKVRTMCTFLFFYSTFIFLSNYSTIILLLLLSLLLMLLLCYCYYYRYYYYNYNYYNSNYYLTYREFIPRLN